MAKIVNKTKVITGPRTRWSYANVWDPKSINGGTPKYSVSLIIPKSDKKTVEAIKAAIQAAYEEGESKLKGNGKTVPALSVIKTPLRDGDAERPDDPVYIFFSGIVKTFCIFLPPKPFKGWHYILKEALDFMSSLVAHLYGKGNSI